MVSTQVESFAGPAGSKRPIAVVTRSMVSCEVLYGGAMAGGSEQAGEQREHGPGVVVDQLAQRDSVTALCVAQGLCIELGPAGTPVGVGSHRPLTSRT